MNKMNLRRYRWIELTFSSLIILALLAGCGGNSPADPNQPDPLSVDPNQVYTSGAQTVVAQLTVDAANRPQPTQAPPTAEPLPTLAPLPAVGATADPLMGGEPLPTAAPGAVLPTMSPLGAPAATGLQPTAAAAANNQYRAVWVSQTPADNVKIGRGQAFTMHWVVTNTGTVTWTKAYMLRFYAGTQLGTNTSVYFPGECAPGKNIDLSVRLTAPTSPGEYVSNWVLSTPDGKNFYSVNITFTVP
ncbi:MAG: NBR1-Ig-like domain-containing protein [Anaerolineaceae bacterium]